MEGLALYRIPHSICTRMTEQRHEAVNQHEIRITGMSRSGNHAIIHWVTRQLGGRYCFLNCAEPKTNPFETARPLHGDRTFEANYDLDLAAERAGHLSRKDVLLHSYEDAFLGMIRSPAFEENHDAWVGPSARRTEVLILRDPFNLFASRRKAQYALVTDHTARRIWKQHAREFVDGPRYLDPERVLVSYNRWASDPEYRREIARQLGLAFSDAGANDVPEVGAGSSFDGTRFSGAAHQMDIFGRWRHFEDDPEYLALLDDPELLRLSEAIFGPIPRTDALTAA